VSRCHEPSHTRAQGRQRGLRNLASCRAKRGGEVASAAACSMVFFAHEHRRSDDLMKWSPVRFRAFAPWRERFEASKFS
jgi:hypothetical protein